MKLVGIIVFLTLGATIPAFGQEVPEKAKEELIPPSLDADYFIIEKSPDILFRVAKVINGNTILLDNGEIVRLLGVEIPVDYSVESYRFLKGFLEGKEVRLEFERRNRNVQGQLLAHVFKEGVSVNNLLRERVSYYHEIDPALSFTPIFLERTFPERGKPMDSWEIIFGEAKPLIMRAKVVLKSKQILRGKLVKETSEYVILKIPFYGKEIIEKEDIEQLTFE